MLNLRAYSTRDLQTIAGVIALAELEGVETLAELKDAVIQATGALFAGMDSQILPPAAVGYCPGCGSRLVVCAESTRLAGTPVRVCARHCGYSTMETQR